MGRSARRGACAWNGGGKVNAAEKTRDRREKLDALQAGYIELARDMMGDGLPYRSLVEMNYAFNEAMAKIMTGIYCVERGIL